MPLLPAMVPPQPQNRLPSEILLPPALQTGEQGRKLTVSLRREGMVISQRKWKAKPDNRHLADPVKERDRVYRWRRLNSEHWKRVFAIYRKGKVWLRRDDRTAGRQRLSYGD
jgi:hypothetical protein